MNLLPKYPPPYPPQKRSILTENVYVPNDIENAIHHWSTVINGAPFISSYPNLSVTLTTKHHPEGACLNFRLHTLGLRLDTLSQEWEYSEWRVRLIPGHRLPKTGFGPAPAVTWEEQKKNIVQDMDEYENQFIVLHSFMGLVLAHLKQDAGFPHQTVEQWLKDHTELSPKIIRICLTGYTSLRQ